MARMHARKRGKSSSTKIFHAQKPDWVDMESDEVEELIVKLAKQNMTSAQIGLILRDQHGVPDVKLVTGKKLTKILADNGLASDIPEDLMFLLRKAVRMHEHMKANNKDLHNKRQLHLTEAKIRRLVRYYVRVNKLPVDWKYTYQKAKLLAE